MKDTMTPLLAVIENSQARALKGQQPVMTVLKPMNRFVAWLYRTFFRPAPIAVDQVAEYLKRAESVEYVVELDGPLFTTLVGTNTYVPRSGASAAAQLRNVRLVLTPSLSTKATAAVTEGDVRP
jgi:hypothetical protein